MGTVAVLALVVFRPHCCPIRIVERTKLQRNERQHCRNNDRGPIHRLAGHGRVSQAVDEYTNAQDQQHDQQEGAEQFLSANQVLNFQDVSYYLRVVPPTTTRIKNKKMAISVARFCHQGRIFISIWPEGFVDEGIYCHILTKSQSVHSLDYDHDPQSFLVYR